MASEARPAGKVPPRPPPRSPRPPPPWSGKSEGQLQLAKVARKVKRYDDMRNAMKEFVKFDHVLSVKHRQLLSEAYHKAIDERFSSWRAVFEKEGKQEDTKEMQAVTRQYRLDIGQELNGICKEALDLISEYLLPRLARRPNDSDVDTKLKMDSKIFYLQMRADYHRYLVEITEVGGQLRRERLDITRHAFHQALQTAIIYQLPDNPTRLTAVVNFSMFLFQLDDDKGAACKLAREAYEEAVKSVHSLPEHIRQKSNELLERIKENLGVWLAAEG